MKSGNPYYYLQLEISSARLLELLEQGSIVAADFHTLNQDSRNSVRNLLLRSINPASAKECTPKTTSSKTTVYEPQSQKRTNIALSIRERTEIERKLL